MKPLHVTLLLTLLCAQGCTDSDAGASMPAAGQPTPTIDSDGVLTVPDGYRAPAIDLSRVDCAGFLEMNPKDLRDAARDLCLQSPTPQERAKNPYCQVHEVTLACTGPRNAAAHWESATDARSAVAHESPTRR